MPQLEAVAIKECRRCKRGKETYHYLDRSYEFDVDKARAFVQDGREPVELEDESVRASVAHSDIDEEHISHVNTTYPGIITHLFYRTEDGAEVQAHLLIDGNHRAARCLQENRPFFAYVLSEEESRSIVIRSPDRPGGLGGPEVNELHEATTHAYQQKFASSRPWAYRAQWAIAGAATHDRRGFGPFGVYVTRALGPRKWDVAGQPLIDLWMGHGALLMGHGFGPVVEAVRRQVELGTHYGACHAMEVEWAELVRHLVPSARRIRFTASGTEATQLALRVARAHTGRPFVLKFDGHFHGWHDEAMSHFYPTQEAGFNPGAVTQVGYSHPTDPAPAIERIAKGDVAAVILEPGGGSSGGLPWSKEFLQALRDATTRHGTVLIFDEVVSGFRHGVGGVQASCGVIPDLTTLAKILCGGLPGGAVAGRVDFMAVLGEGTRVKGRPARVPHTGTFNANPLSAAAGLAMLDYIADGAAQETARVAAERLAAGINAQAEQHGIDVYAYTNGTSIYHLLIGPRRAGAPLGPSHAVAHLHRDQPGHYALLRRALLVEGVDMHPVHGWVSATHDDATVDEAVGAFGRAFAKLREVDGFALPMAG
jgi:glutamate-1-semialdehyde 2,1-aminomutase